MNQAHQGGHAADQAISARRGSGAVPPGQIIRTTRHLASHSTSHKQHGATGADEGRRHTDPLTSRPPDRWLGTAVFGFGRSSSQRGRRRNLREGACHQDALLGLRRNLDLATSGGELDGDRVVA
jgi:hypothetical protein